jgi:hypothetical protein
MAGCRRPGFRYRAEGDPEASGKARGPDRLPFPCFRVRDVLPGRHPAFDGPASSPSSMDILGSELLEHASYGMVHVQCMIDAPCCQTET